MTGIPARRVLTTENSRQRQVRTTNLQRVPGNGPTLARSAGVLSNYSPLAFFSLLFSLSSTAFSPSPAFCISFFCFCS